MFDIKCTVCNGEVVLDQQRTINSYIGTKEYVVNKQGELDIDTLQKYMYYKCLSCNAPYKYTIVDIERELRKGFAEMVMSLRKKQVFDKNLHKVTEGSVLSYCGKCRGQDGKGRCFSVIMDNCSIRNK